MQLERYIADLVQKKRSFVRQLEPSNKRIQEKWIVPPGTAALAPCCTGKGFIPRRYTAELGYPLAEVPNEEK